MLVILMPKIYTLPIYLKILKFVPNVHVHNFPRKFLNVSKMCNSLCRVNINVVSSGKVKEEKIIYFATWYIVFTKHLSSFWSVRQNEVRDYNVTPHHKLQHVRSFQDILDITKSYPSECSQNLYRY